MSVPMAHPRNLRPRPTPVPTATLPPALPAARSVPEDQVRPSDEGSRRMLNVTVAATGLVVAAPLMALIAILVKLTSKGPVFYTQTRIGLDRRQDGTGHARRIVNLGGRPFLIYKFRTMEVDAERQTGAVWATSNDPRVTWLGRILRQFRLDELPQLLNVLKGDMNIVGPRPERPGIFQEMRDQIPSYPLRQRARPGITGLAQINQQYDTSVDDVRRKVDYDLVYIGDRQGVWEDLKIMIKTIPVILFRKGAR